MGRLGWSFTFGIFVSISVDGRSLLFPPAAAVAAFTLVSLGEAVQADAPRRSLGLAAVLAGGAAALAAVSFVPGIDDDGPAILALLAAAASTGLYAHGMGRWCEAGGWHAIARVWARAGRTAIASVVACLALVVVVLQGPASAGPAPGEVTEPTVAFGRQVETSGSWAVGVVVVTMAATAWRIATGHRSMRAAFEQHGTPTVSAAALLTS